MIRIAKYFFFLLIGVVALWVAVNLRDETLSPEFHDFFHDDPVDEAQNGFVALSGIDAPEDASPLSYGQQMLGSSNTGIASKNTISFKGNARFDCWVQYRQNRGTCPDKASLIQSLKDNRLLLSRYIELRRYPRFVDSFSGWQNGGVLITLNELFLARLAMLVSEDHTDAALNYWLEDVRYWQRVIADKQGIVGKSIIMAVYNRSMQFLPVIIDANPALAGNYAIPLAEVLSVPAFGSGGWNVATTLQAEQEVLKTVEALARNRSDFTTWLYKENATSNTLLAFAQDMVSLSKQPPERFMEERQTLEDKYRGRPLVLKLFYNPVGNLVLDGVFVGAGLMDSQLYAFAYRRMLHLYVTAKAKGISPANMPDFVTHATTDLRNPVTGEPFGWDEATHSVYFSLPGAPSTRREIFY